ncbi:hydroxyacylglutathione hydrolase [Robiginitomaculum antarcticum]|uniref:hydroxyacylglutathione hydrolase n=1 Tax=Robiginitomaculum antarcticum TaxID=437507 RepID=UPI00036E5E1B|nr:hydroxyacylglutathione hydrolase [Robiginitomaculum antarcticum]
MSLKIILFPCLSDNYGFILRCTNTGQTACIDTPDAGEISKQLQTRGWGLDYIFNTHHHPDHTGGNAALKRKYGPTIIGPKAEETRIPLIDEAVSEGSIVRLGDCKAVIWDTPAHTAGHINYYFKEEDVIFVGDTLFALGCGRLFEGSAAQMWAAMARYRDLPKPTKVYCAHEYTLSNARFAQTIESGNPDLADYITDAKSKRDGGLPTVPTTIGAEIAANPFMRADKDAVARAVNMKGHSPEDVLGEVRRRKDSFRG